MAIAANNIGLNFDNSYEKELEGFYVPWKGEAWPEPKIIRINQTLCGELGLSLDTLDRHQLAAMFSGSEMIEGAKPLAQVYAGHQFGSFTPQLGDGRALLLGEVIDRLGNRRDIQLKGSGKTPFSRGGDGKAAIGPVLREYLVSEAMHALGIPTTRALAAISTGQNVFREKALPGAVLTRVAASHLRVGTFQYFAAQNEYDKLEQLADYAIARHYPALISEPDRYLQFLGCVCKSQARLVAKWMSAGFIHGVMNTDNCTISGETIDYGPCAFMDNYDPSTVFSSIDTHGRYQYQNQPSIAVWNLSRLADTLLQLIDKNQERSIEKATSVLETFAKTYYSCWLNEMRKKLGLNIEQESDLDLVNDLLKTMQQQRVDFTLLFRSLADAASSDATMTRSLFEEPAEIDPWLLNWQERRKQETQHINASIAMMNASNPIYIPRNHKVEEALSAATEHEDFTLFETLLEILSRPTEKRTGFEEYETPAPETFGHYQTFCGT